MVMHSAHLESAEADHAVHHLADAETVTEVVKRVIPVVVMNTHLQRQRKTRLCFVSYTAEELIADMDA